MDRGQKKASEIHDLEKLKLKYNMKELNGTVVGRVMEFAFDGMAFV